METRRPHEWGVSLGDCPEIKPLDARDLALARQRFRTTITQFFRTNRELLRRSKKCGDILNDVQRAVHPATFWDWVRDDCGVTVTIAENYMRLSSSWDWLQQHHASFEREDLITVLDLLDARDNHVIDVESWEPSESNTSQDDAVSETAPAMPAEPAQPLDKEDERGDDEDDWGDAADMPSPDERIPERTFCLPKNRRPIPGHGTGLSPQRILERFPREFLEEVRFKLDATVCGNVHAFAQTALRQSEALDKAVDGDSILLAHALLFDFLDRADAVTLLWYLTDRLAKR